ncbi:NADP-dependent oxidoreductase [Nocardia aurantia]|uniref:2-haloacrylate reductase n=1 Tax=Nocardia aurantia TaxID=2585199 RepID=A0A7K0DWD9_9NOCA|nr:NADP-dependent oxidoreductase [Nocardia aurantia]MQY30089.1 2-haloacrylate reductase [Nocardia aurantia]
MKAVRFHAYGDTDVLVYEEAKRPVAGTGQVVVRVTATAFNPVDAAIRAGYLRDAFPLTFPHTPGIDVAGVITEVGAGVDGWQPGDEVVAFLPMNEPGSAAEYVLAPAATLAAAPKSVDLADAAALPSGSLTARQSLFEHAELKSGQTILINGAGGSVGGYAVQLAHRAGALVTATAGPRSADRVRAYGADRIIDHTTTPLPQALAGKRFDAVLNLVSTTPEETAALVDLVADGGVFVSATTPYTADPGRNVRTVQVFVRSDADRLTELVRQVDTGDLKIHVAQRRPLSDLAAVHAEAAAGRLPGKTVLIP